MITFQLDRFRDHVKAAVDPTDTNPGVLTRAYVRAAFADMVGHDEHAHERALLLGTVGADPQLRQIMATDTHRWRTDLAEDGLDEQRVTIILRAANGTTLAAISEGTLDVEDADRTEHWLLELTRGTGPLS